MRRKTRDVYQGVGAQHLEPSGIQKVGAQHLKPSGIPKGIPLWYFVGCWRELQQQQIVLTPFTPFRGLGGKRGLEEKYIPPRSNLSPISPILGVQLVQWDLTFTAPAKRN